MKLFLHTAQSNFLLSTINQLYDDLEPQYLQTFILESWATYVYIEIRTFDIFSIRISNVTFLLSFSVSEELLGHLLARFNKNELIIILCYTI